MFQKVSVGSLYVHISIHTQALYKQKGLYLLNDYHSYQINN